MTTQPKPQKPLATPSKDNEPFWEGLKHREFRVQRCSDCGSYRWLPKPACPSCMSIEHEWITTSGEGTVWTYTTIFRAGPAFQEALPFTVAAVELKEKPLKCLVMSWIIDCEPEDVRIGMPVKIKFEDVPGEDMTIYKFVPV